MEASSMFRHQLQGLWFLQYLILDNYNFSDNPNSCWLVVILLVLIVVVGFSSGTVEISQWVGKVGFVIKLAKYVQKNVIKMWRSISPKKITNSYSKDRVKFYKYTKLRIHSNEVCRALINASPLCIYFLNDSQYVKEKFSLSLLTNRFNCIWCQSLLAWFSIRILDLNGPDRKSMPYYCISCLSKARLLFKTHAMSVS